MFIFNNTNELDEIFGVKGIETGGQNKGKIYKLEHEYFKVYDHPKKESTYIVEGYHYYRQTPFLVNEIPYNKMKEFASYYVN